MTAAPTAAGPVQRVARVLDNLPAGDYRRLVLAEPQLAARVRAGQFVAAAVGEEPTAMLLRRAFSVHRADAGAGTLELVVAAHGPGSEWVTRRRPGQGLDLVGPLGRPYPMPEPGTVCVLVGGGYGSAPLIWLAGQLAAAGHQVHAVLGAADAARLFGADAAAAVTSSLTLTTDDGSLGLAGLVTDPLPDLLAGTGAGLVYACGPMAMLRAVHAVAAAHGARAWCTVEESMACGIGVCMTCVLPVLGPDGQVRMTRTCTDGPTLDGDTICWDTIGRPLAPAGPGAH